MSLPLSWTFSPPTVFEQFQSTSIFHNSREKKKMTGFQGTRWENLRATWLLFKMRVDKKRRDLHFLFGSSHLT